MPRSFRDMEEDMERFMEEAYRMWPLRHTWRRTPEQDYAWAPSMDMYETEDSFVLRFELPGVAPEDVDISLAEGMLTVKGSRKVPGGGKDQEYQCTEICYGSFSRSVTIPGSINPDQIEASFNNGVLEVQIPKVEEAKPKQIKLQVKTSPSAQSGQGSASSQAGRKDQTTQTEQEQASQSQTKKSTPRSGRSTKEITPEEQDGMNTNP